MTKPQRILLVGEFWFGSSGAGIAHGMRALGHEVEELDIRDHFAIGTSLVSKIITRLVLGWSIKSLRNAVIAAVSRRPADILLTVKGSYLNPATLAAVRQRGAICVNYYPDVTFNHPDFSDDWLESFDVIATTKSYHLAWLAKYAPKLPAGLVHHGYSSLVHRKSGLPMDESSFDWDICYIGNPSPYKRDWLSAMVAANPGRRILLGGNGWHRVAEGSALETCEIVGPVSGDFFARAIERSRINLGIHFGPAGENGWQDHVSTRTFEIPACGGFMLHIDNPELRAMFKPGEECDVFDTPEDLNAKIAYYLDHPERRMAIAAAGHARAVPAYSYDARAAEIMELIGDRL